jgi:hypothetical protein
MYQATPNAAFRNSDLPTRRPDGSLVQKPQAALDLHYLFSFYGDDTHFEPQRLLGSLVRTLHSQPLFSRDEITKAIGALIASDATLSFLSASDLANQLERIRFTPLSVSLDELSKIWSIFYQVPYALSAVYQASVVLLESTDTPQQALPVGKRNVYGIPFQLPAINQILAMAGPGQPILPNSTVRILGTGLLAGITSVQIAGNTVAPQTATDSEIDVQIPASVPAGVQGLQIIQQFQMGEPPTPHTGFESNVAAFVLSSVISSPSVTAGKLNLTVTPVARQNQRVMLLLNEATAPPPPVPAAYRLSLPPLAADTSTLAFDVTSVKGGGTSYFVRIQVDGATSPLDLNPASATFGPTVVIS